MLTEFVVGWIMAEENIISNPVDSVFSALIAFKIDRGIEQYSWLNGGYDEQIRFGVIEK